MFLFTALLFVVLGHLMQIGVVIFAAGVAGAVWLFVTRPRPSVDTAAVPAPRRPAGSVVPRQFGDRDPLRGRRPIA